MDQIHIWRSPAQGQDHCNKKKRKNHYSRNVKLWSVITLDSIEDSAMKSVCSIEFPTMADEMMWPLSLWRDQKWPCLTKYMHLQTACLRLGGHFVFAISNVIKHDNVYMSQQCNAIIKHYINIICSNCPPLIATDQLLDQWPSAECLTTSEASDTWNRRS